MQSWAVSDQVPARHCFKMIFEPLSFVSVMFLQKLEANRTYNYIDVLRLWTIALINENNGPNY